MSHITCKCGHTDEFDRFTSTQLGPLPRGQYQCPRCCRAWAIVKQGHGQQLASGQYIPAKRTIIAAQAQL